MPIYVTKRRLCNENPVYHTICQIAIRRPEKDVVACEHLIIDFTRILLMGREAGLKTFA